MPLRVGGILAQPRPFSISNATSTGLPCPRQVDKFIHACSLCSQSKPSNHKHGLYQPLPVPSHPWESISMDFLSGLPTTLCKHDAIWVVFVIFLRWISFSPVIRLPLLLKPSISSSIIFGPTSDCPVALFLIGTLIFSVPFGILSGLFWVANFVFPPPFTPDQTGNKSCQSYFGPLPSSYFSKNKQWDSYLHIIQHSYNQATHSSTGFSPFKVCFGFHPLAPSEMPLTLDPSGSSHQQQEQQSTQCFIQTIAQCHTQVVAALQATQDCAKQRHDKHHTQLFFQPRDRVWLLLDKQPFKGQHHKLHPLRYGPYTVLECIGENAYHLDLPSQLDIHDVLNVNNLKLFEPPLLEEAVTVHHPVDNIPYFQPPLLADTILDSKTRTTRQQKYLSYLVGRKGHTPAQAKWMSAEALKRTFLICWWKKGCFGSNLNREELGHQEGRTPSLATHYEEGTL
jgi:hypothetical protein